MSQTYDYKAEFGPRIPLVERLERSKGRDNKEQSLRDQKAPIIPPPGAAREDFRPVPPDVREFPIHGIQAWRKIVDMADQHAKYVEDSGNKAMQIALQFEKDCLQSVKEACKPLLEIASKFEALSGETAKNVRNIARTQADAAALFSKRLDAMSHSLADAANGEGKAEEPLVTKDKIQQEPS